MKKKVVYIVVGVVLLLVAIIVIGGKYINKINEQSTNMTPSSFYSKDKKAGGAYVAFKLLQQLFDRHTIQVVTKPFARTYQKEGELKSSGNVYLMVADELFLTEKDIDAMMAYVAAGNELFIAANVPDPALAKQLNFSCMQSTSYNRHPTFVQQYRDSTIPLHTTYHYDGVVGENYFSKIDSSTTTVLGTNFKNDPNFIRIAYSSGFIYVLMNPYTFTNYFLLHKNNVASLETQMGYLQQDAANIYWDDFYNGQHTPQSGNFSEWQVLMRYPSLRWALGLIVALLLLYVLFESKRRQRIIPEKPPVTNTSLEFVDAIGQLYYQQHNNYNLVHKMILHLMEYIRSRYYLNTNYLDDAFVAALSKKSAISQMEVSELIQMIHQINLEGNVSDETLQEFYKRIQLFYLNAQ
ncbi:DUF4350 domain-containing protein [Chitinophaga sp. 30R24]|uniref:DUF4350 domain-containing protein n=1 Tax=Chitinophaga sp. 30R24 TaxID=3248838 RepID=UPI003B90993B